MDRLTNCLPNSQEQDIDMSFNSPVFDLNKQEILCQSLFTSPRNELSEIQQFQLEFTRKDQSSFPFLDLEDPSDMNQTRKKPIDQSKLHELTPMTVISYEGTNRFPSGVSTQCKCRKSQCLRLHCVCFSAGGICGAQCSCIGCVNQPEFDKVRQFVIAKTKEINPLAFTSKMQTLSNFEGRLNSQGCRCQRNNCQKNYCDCYKNGVGCWSNCRCTSCKNEKKEIPKEDSTVILKRVFRKKHKIVFDKINEIEDEGQPVSRSISFVRHHKKKVKNLKNSEKKT